MSAWNYKVPSYRGLPRGSHARVLSMEGYVTAGEACALMMEEIVGQYRGECKQEQQRGEEWKVLFGIEN